MKWNEAVDGGKTLNVIHYSAMSTNWRLACARPKGVASANPMKTTCKTCRKMLVHREALEKLRLAKSKSGGVK